MKKNTIFLFQIILTTMQGMVYFLSENGNISFFVINFSAFSVILSFILSWQCRQITEIRGFGFSIIVLFTLMSWIISFQVPLEIVYGNLSLLDSSLRLVSNPDVINKLVAFCSLMLNFFLIGVTYSYSNTKFLLTKKINENKIKAYPLLILIGICFFIFLVTFNKDYSHGEVKIDSMSAAAYGFLVKFSAIYLAIIIFNAQKNNKASILKYFRILNIYYLILIVVSCVFFFLASNRIYSIMLIMPLIFGYFIYVRKKISVFTVTLFLISLNVIGVLFKVYGFFDFYKQGFYISESYIFSKFLFPFTAELAGSFYSSNILFSMWENGLSLYGMSFLVGLLRIIPGVMGFLSLSPSIYDSAVIATLYSGANYGVGTTAIIDLLVNFGFVVSLVIFIYVGYFFGKSELKVYSDNSSIYSYVVFFTVTILILFYPRASINDLLSMVFFNLIFCKFYFSIFNSRSK